MERHAWGLFAVVWGMLLNGLATGCSTSHRGAEINALRNGWAQGWVASQPKQFSLYYEDYLRNEAPRRENYFFQLVTALGGLDPAPFGTQVLDVLGSPDYWADVGDGSVVVIYRCVVNRPPPEEGFLRLKFDRAGRLQSVSWSMPRLSPVLRYHSVQ